MATTIPPPALAAPPNAIASAPGGAAEQAGDCEGANAGGAAAGSYSRVRQPRSSPINSPDAECDGKREIRSWTSMGNPARARTVQPQSGRAYP